MEEQKQRTFGYAKIVWETENCFCIAYRNNWEIYSHEFSINGFLSIKWRFVLRGTKIDNTDNEYKAWLDLERLESGDTTRFVRVSWNASFLFQSTPIRVCVRECDFHTKGCVSSEIDDFRRVQERIQNISTDKISIEAIFLVKSTEESASLEGSHDSGLNSLSKQLDAIYDLEDYNDLTIKMGENSMKKNKAILSIGSRLLKNCINVISNEEISLPSSDMESAKELFRYLYTGNLEYVLRQPSILIDQAIEYLGVKELEKYYMKDEIILSTKYEVGELYYKWEVPDISSDNSDLIYSPYFGTRDFNVTFRFRLEMRAIFASTGNAVLFLEASAFPRQLQEIYIMFDIVHILTGTSLNRKKSQRLSIEGAGAFRLDNFLNANDLKPLATVGNELHGLGIICKIFIPTDELTLLEVSNRTCLLPFLDYEEHFRLFSKRIESLFLNSVYSDLTISCGDDEFHVHKCILSARSPVFAEVIRRPEHSKGFSTGNIDARILKIVLVYIYSGVLKNYELSDVSEIYRAASVLGMLTLIYHCTKILEERLLLSNVMDTLFLADQCNGIHLKFSAFRFIMYNRREIDIDTLNRLVEEKRLLHEFEMYVKMFLRDNPGEMDRLK